MGKEVDDRAYERSHAMMKYAESVFRQKYSAVPLADQDEDYREWYEADCLWIDKCRRVVSEFAPKPVRF